MNNLLKLGTAILIASIIAVIWGMNYVSTHRLSGFANAFGNVDSTYDIANLATIIGFIGAFIGVAFLIGGFVKK
jgi:hypothetical protein